MLPCDQISAIAKEAASCLEFARRTNGNEFVRFKEDTPEDIRKAILDAHENLDASRDDWLYNKTWNLLAFLDENKESYWYSLKDEWCVTERDPYNHHRYKWLLEFPGAAEISDNATAAHGEKCTAGIDARLGHGQSYVLHRLWVHVVMNLSDVVAAREAAKEEADGNDQ